jgi:hypothetical protein
MFRHFLFALTFCIAARATAGEPWLLAFPDIRHDAKYAYFSGPKWTSFYIPQYGSVSTVPRDSLNLPEAVPPSNLVVIGECSYLCSETRLLSSCPGVGDSLRLLPPPTRDAVACLSVAGGRTSDASLLFEVMGPVAGHGGRLWFGLSLTDTAAHATVAGIGWFDPASNLFARIYSPSLARCRPEWIGAVHDSVYVLFGKIVKGQRVESKLVSLDITHSALTEHNLRNLGVPGDVILSASQWHDTLLFATDQAIAIWKPHRRPNAWLSKAYACNEMRWLYLKTFPGGNPDKGKPVQFIPLKSNTPTDIKAKIGSWMQVVAPVGIEAYVDPDEWERHGVMWSQRNWHCGDTLCFARLSVPMKGREVETDFTNTPLTYLSRDNNGVKVGFRAAWAREEDLIPVMMLP